MIGIWWLLNFYALFISHVNSVLYMKCVMRGLHEKPLCVMLGKKTPLKIPCFETSPTVTRVLFAFVAVHEDIKCFYDLDINQVRECQLI